MPYAGYAQSIMFVQSRECSGVGFWVSGTKTDSGLPLHPIFISAVPFYNDGI